MVFRSGEKLRKRKKFGGWVKMLQSKNILQQWKREEIVRSMNILQLWRMRLIQMRISLNSMLELVLQTIYVAHGEPLQQWLLLVVT